MTENSSVFGLRRQARCLTAVTNSTEQSKFLAGTVGAKDNVVCLLEFDDDVGSIKPTMYSHPEEVWDITSCPTNEDLFFTCHSPDNKSDQHCALNPIHLGPLEQNQHVTLLTIDVSPTWTNSFAIQQLQNAVWNPHQPEIITVGGQNLSGWDLRSAKSSFHHPEAHKTTIRAVDYNPNKPHCIATGGDDAMVSIWDTRQLKNQVMQIERHTHWVWSVAFNHLQDQLLLTSGSDALVQLHNIFSASSAAYLNDNEEENESIEGSEVNKPMDGLVRTYDQHEDSVYQVAWSPADIWTFASISYAGRVVISQVPQDEKFKILGV
ncbi:WD40-repeat-containing domain protein [Cokeromyces recurvatus]|uniref:WD40-repeat-containing domain protein n=1 Tax=Cokeromyces recurvatus TaxID=90255 RepID=UPI00221F5A54|nr:WD40-repeat-containing domain protein [Cokeromyces recurvatus]KAI7905573.1 WD40-repeat-containing domain protein [Cokeromyces recurvatus]